MENNTPMCSINYSHVTVSTHISPSRTWTRMVCSRPLVACTSGGATSGSAPFRGMCSTGLGSEFPRPPEGTLLCRQERLEEFGRETTIASPAPLEHTHYPSPVPPPALSSSTSFLASAARSAASRFTCPTSSSRARAKERAAAARQG